MILAGLWTGRPCPALEGRNEDERPVFELAAAYPVSVCVAACAGVLGREHDRPELPDV